MFQAATEPHPHPPYESNAQRPAPSGQGGEDRHGGFHGEQANGLLLVFRRVSVRRSRGSVRVMRCSCFRGGAW